MTTLKFKPVRTTPVAKFYYKGNHSHPVRRTVLVTEVTDKFIRGYELRCGSVVRTAASGAPIRTYRKDSIATFGDLRPDSTARRKNRKSVTTLQRSGLLDLVATGV
jgi:hypothetical protein